MTHLGMAWGAPRLDSDVHPNALGLDALPYKWKWSAWSPYEETTAHRRRLPWIPKDDQRFKDMWTKQPKHRDYAGGLLIWNEPDGLPVGRIVDLIEWARQVSPNASIIGPHWSQNIIFGTNCKKPKQVREEYLRRGGNPAKWRQEGVHLYLLNSNPDPSNWIDKFRKTLWSPQTNAVWMTECGIRDATYSNARIFYDTLFQCPYLGQAWIYGPRTDGYEGNLPRYTLINRYGLTPNGIAYHDALYKIL